MCLGGGGNIHVRGLTVYMLYRGLTAYRVGCVLYRGLTVYIW